MKLARVTLTGADDTTSVGWMQDVSAEYPFVEWGILFSQQQTGLPRFPSPDWTASLYEAKQATPAMQLSGHICGRFCREIFKGNWLAIQRAPQFVLRRFDRIQLNIGRAEETDKYLQPEFIRETYSLQLRHGFGLIIQTQNQRDEIASEVNARGIAAYPLYDNSGGTGQLPKSWPVPHATIGPCGYAGGLSPANVLDQLDQIAEPAGDRRIWIDMEARIRDDRDRLDTKAIGDMLSALAKSPYLSKRELDAHSSSD